MTNAELRLADLRRKPRKAASKLLNVKVPLEVAKEFHRVAIDMGQSKTAVFIALINEGLDVAAVALRDHKKRPEEPVPRGRQCSARGCQRQRVAKGLCASHYQAQRRPPVK